MPLLTHVLRVTPSDYGAKASRLEAFRDSNVPASTRALLTNSLVAFTPSQGAHYGLIQEYGLNYIGIRNVI